MQNKVPGLHFEVQQMRMDLLYSSKFFQRKLPEAYERLLLEVLAADHSHFVSAEELDASWHIFTPVLQELEALAPPHAADAGPARRPNPAWPRWAASRARAAPTHRGPQSRPFPLEPPVRPQGRRP